MDLNIITIYTRIYMCYIDLGRRYCNGRNALPRSGNSRQQQELADLPAADMEVNNMSFWDWDLDGDEDLLDEAIEYDILTEETDEDND